MKNLNLRQWTFLLEILEPRQIIWEVCLPLGKLKVQNSQLYFFNFHGSFAIYVFRYDHFILSHKRPNLENPNLLSNKTLEK